MIDIHFFRLLSFTKEAIIEAHTFTLIYGMANSFFYFATLYSPLSFSLSSVTARKDEPQYRLSRGICAFSLHV
jgi:hypothetical protein